MTNKKYFFYIVLTIPCDMIKNFILKTFIVRKIHYERKLALFFKKSDKQEVEICQLLAVDLLKAIKRAILQQMESLLDELKSTVVEMIEKFASNRTYAKVAKDASSVAFVGQASFENPQNMLFSNVSSSSETQFKTVFTPDSRPKDNKPIPVTSI